MRIATRAKRRPPLSVTSLIDVIFLLLLFFMLTSTFVRHQSVEIVAPAPQGAAGQSAPDVILRAGARESFTLNGQAVPAADLLARLTALREAGGAKLLVTPQSGADSQSLVGAVEAARRAGFTSVSVAD